MARPSTVIKEDTRRALKRAARRLFAERGVDGVSVREIVEAAGQRNSGALHYYFGTKDELVEELVVDGARLIHEAREVMLREMDAAGGPQTIRDVVRALLLPNLEIGGDSGEQETYIRFIRGLQSYRHRGRFLAVLEQRWALGYQRCLSELRLMLAPLAPELINQRLLFMGMTMHTLLASREEALDLSGSAPHPFWSAPHTIESMIDSLQAMIEHAPSQQLLTAFDLRPAPEG